MDFISLMSSGKLYIVLIIQILHLDRNMTLIKFPELYNNQPPNTYSYSINIQLKHNLRHSMEQSSTS